MTAVAACYADVFATVFAFNAARDDDRPGYGAFRAHVMSLLDDARRRIDADRLDARGYAHYAVVALVDEMAMKTDWDGADRWRREPLQVHYYGNLLAGEHFFQRVDELRAGGDDDGLLEVYFLCLCAGFQGRFRDEPAELRSRRQRLFQQLRGVVDLRDATHVTDEAYGRELERSLTRTRFPLWWLAPFVLGAVGLYVAFWVVLQQQVSGLVALAG